jgi:hypothetical protein
MISVEHFTGNSAGRTAADTSPGDLGTPAERTAVSEGVLEASLRDSPPETREKGEALLTAAAAAYPRAAYVLALDHFRAARYGEGRELLLKIRGIGEAPGTPRTLLSVTPAEVEDRGSPLKGEERTATSGSSENLKAAACRKLAIDAERRLKNPQLALEYFNSALAFLEKGSTLQEDMIRRREKLLKKLDDCGGIP